MTTQPIPTTHPLTPLRVSIETRELLFYQRGGKRYVSLPSIAEAMTPGAIHTNLRRLSHLYNRISDSLREEDVITLPDTMIGSVAPPIEHYLCERVGLSIPAAIRLLSRSAARDILQMLDVLTRQIDATGR